MSSSKLGDLLEPLGDRVAVLVESKSERTPSGLHIPLETARTIHEEKATQGVVVAVGPDVEDVQLGWTVLFGKYTGTRIRYKAPLHDGATLEETIAYNAAPQETVIIMTETSILSRLLDSDEAKNFKVK